MLPRPHIPLLLAHERAGRVLHHILQRRSGERHGQFRRLILHTSQILEFYSWRRMPQRLGWRLEQLMR